MAAQSTYAFKARDHDGQIVTGTISAGSADEVSARLRGEGKYVLAIEDRAMRAIADIDAAQIRLNESAKRVRREDIIALCQQLSVMLDTGVPVVDALDAFCEQARRPELKMVLRSLRDDLHSGEPFSKAMAKWPRVFPTMMVSLMKASEASGTMAMMLGRVGDYMAKERRTARQIKGALSYPMFMMASCLAMTVFLMAFVLPRFATIYESRSATLPTPTRVLLSISNFLVHEYHLFGPVLAVLVAAALFWVRMPSGRHAVDWLKLTVPVLSPMFRQFYITRFARTMATLLAAGVGLLDIIDICRGVTNNSVYDRLWNDMELGIRDGKQMSAAINESRLIPANVASMITSGEKSGRLPNVMEKIAEFSDQELDAQVKKVTSYIEPMMIMFMGVVIGGVALALLLPIFSLGKVVSGG
jgi:type IV pilus assembly protein PilC